MEDILYQKTGLTVSRIAEDLLYRNVGDRIPSVSEYMDQFKVSRGTIQNGLAYLKEQEAVTFVNKGHMGRYILTINRRRLQELTLAKELLGSMPLPYSKTYQGLATALYELLSPFSINLVYARGAEGRLKLVESGALHFTVCSRYAALQAEHQQKNLMIAVDLGPGTYLSRHVLIFGNREISAIQPGMRVAYDRDSIDQSKITELVTRNIPDVTLVEMRTHQTVSAIRKGIIDAGVWNLDQILEAKYDDFGIVTLDHAEYTDAFSSAVMVVRKDDEPLRQLLQRHVLPERLRSTQEAVHSGVLEPNY